MSTKAERFRTEAQRASSKKKRKSVKVAKAPKKKAATKAAEPLSKNQSKAAGRKASFALEASGEHAQPSRKSTRASANRQKPDSNLKRRETRRVTSPERRAARGK